AERLHGSLSKHTAYVTHAARADTASAGSPDDDDVPHFAAKAPPKKLAELAEKAAFISMTTRIGKARIDVPKEAASVLVHVDGKRTLGELRKASGLSKGAFQKVWKAIDDGFRPWGTLHYSRLLIS
ncbi:MAG: hypothetical protein AAFX00_12515, partial [Pseudomonadota bacterium]